MKQMCMIMYHYCSQTQLHSGGEVRQAQRSQSEVERLSADADAQLARYLADKNLAPMLEDTIVYPLKIVFHGPHMEIRAQM